MTMKNYKNISIAIIAVLLIVSFIFKSDAASSHQGIDKENFAKEAIASYLKNQDLNEKNDLSKYFHNISKAYLDSKVRIFNYNSTVNHIHKTNYDMEFILLDEIIVQEKTLLKFQVISTWNYLGDSDESGQSREIHILFDEDIDPDKIVDIYSPFDFFDEVERGEFLDILNPKNGINSIKTIDLEDLELKYKNNINNSYKEQITP